LMIRGSRTFAAKLWEEALVRRAELFVEGDRPGMVGHRPMDRERFRAKLAIGSKCAAVEMDCLRVLWSLGGRRGPAGSLRLKLGVPDNAIVTQRRAESGADADCSTAASAGSISFGCEPGTAARAACPICGERALPQAGRQAICCRWLAPCSSVKRSESIVDEKVKSTIPSTMQVKTPLCLSTWSCRRPEVASFVWHNDRQ